jgi:hypothetical protein
MRRLRPAFRLESLPQFLLAVVVVLLAALIVGSMIQYVTVAEAHALPALRATPLVQFRGLDAGGNLTENGSVVFNLTLGVSNPSPRALFFEQAVFKAWILDEPVQAGLTNLGRPDNVLINATGTWHFYLAFYGSTGLSPERVPPGGNGNTFLGFTVSRATDSGTFEVLRNITAFARAHGVALSAIPWNVYALTSLIIDGVPAPASSSAADYLRDITRVVLQEGPDLGA